MKPILSRGIPRSKVYVVLACSLRKKKYFEKFSSIHQRKAAR